MGLTYNNPKNFYRKEFIMKKITKNDIKAFSGEVMTGVATSKVMKYGLGPAILLGSTAQAFAAGDLLKNLKNVMQQLFKWIIGISTALAVLLIAWNILKYMAATDPQSAMMAKKNAIRVAIAWVLLNSMSGVIALMTGLTKGNTGENDAIWN